MNFDSINRPEVLSYITEIEEFYNRHFGEIGGRPQWSFPMPLHASINLQLNKYFPYWNLAQIFSYLLPSYNEFGYGDMLRCFRPASLENYLDQDFGDCFDDASCWPYARLATDCEANSCGFIFNPDLKSVKFIVGPEQMTYEYLKIPKDFISERAWESGLSSELFQVSDGWWNIPEILEWCIGNPKADSLYEVFAYPSISKKFTTQISTESGLQW